MAKIIMFILCTVCGASPQLWLGTPRTNLGRLECTRSQLSIQRVPAIYIACAEIPTMSPFVARASTCRPRSRAIPLLWMLVELATGTQRRIAISKQASTTCIRRIHTMRRAVSLLVYSYSYTHDFHACPSHQHSLCRLGTKRSTSQTIVR